MNQLTTVLNNYETAQRELSSHKQQLEIYRGDTSLLLSPEDCEHLENEIYTLLYKIKAKKVAPSHPYPLWSHNTISTFPLFCYRVSC
jgi:hypothetical protein